MKSRSIFAAVFVLAFLFILTAFPVNAATASGDAMEMNKPSRKRLRAFKSERDLKKFFAKITKKRLGVGYGTGSGSGSGMGDTSSASAVVTVASAAPAESITNTQHASVDEGGIVKMHRNHLVILRRGRLFTVAIGDGSLRPVASIDAFGPDIDSNGSWYDEMLISGDNIVVIGYSYDRGGTELGLFKIEADGGLKYRATYHLRSNDYYSSRNYSSRLIGDKLIFYSPLNVNVYDEDLASSFPALRRWHKEAKESEFRRIVEATKIYRPESGVDYEDDLTLHTVTTCDLSGAEMKCDAVSVMGPSGHSFYVSPRSVWVWAAAWDSDEEKERNRSILIRMPFDEPHPSALRVSGSPVDQFSFLEEESGASLNVLVRSESEGDGMWKAEVGEGDIALLRVTLNDLADGSTAARRSSYRALEKVPGYTLQNRFIGDHLLYGAGANWGEPSNTVGGIVHVVNWKTGTRSKLTLPHDVDRLDQLAGQAIVIGANSNDLYFSSVALRGLPRLVDTYKLEGASQGETRSHGFFYKPESGDGGVLGLPVTYSGRPGYRQLREGSASIIFLRNDSLRFSEIGRLASGPAEALNDNCKASCVDWYGNARPIFAGGRIFALLGYEIVEGTLRSGRIEEVRRADFAPRAETATSAQ